MIPLEHPTVSRISGWLHRRAENILAVMLGTMFVAFLIQIALRYLTDWSTGWTAELSKTLWLWLVLFGAAFVTRESEEIRFDLIYGTVGRKTQRIMLLLASLGLLAIYGLSLPGAWDYVSFMRVEKTDYMKLRRDWVYCIYPVFLLAILARHLFLAWRSVFRPPPDPPHDTVEPIA